MLELQAFYCRFCLGPSNDIMDIDEKMTLPPYWGFQRYVFIDVMRKSMSIMVLLLYFPVAI